MLFIGSWPCQEQPVHNVNFPSTGASLTRVFLDPRCKEHNRLDCKTRGKNSGLLTFLMRNCWCWGCWFHPSKPRWCSRSICNFSGNWQGALLRGQTCLHSNYTVSGVALPPPSIILTCEKQTTLFSCTWPTSTWAEVSWSPSWAAHRPVFVLAKTQFRWYLNKTKQNKKRFGFYWTVWISGPQPWPRAGPAWWWLERRCPGSKAAALGQRCPQMEFAALWSWRFCLEACAPRLQPARTAQRAVLT